MGLKSNQEALGFAITFVPLLHPWAYFHYIGHYCSLQDLQLSKIIDDRSFSGAYSIVPSSTLKGSQQGGSFFVSTNFISPCLYQSM